MRKTRLTVVAWCATLLWAGVVYAQDQVEIGVESLGGQSAEGSGEGLFGQFGEGCPQFFEPQRFPATGQTTSYVAGDDGDIKAGAPLRYRDNGDGTITDENTKLMWEKKDQASGGLHNWNNTYPWTGSPNIFDFVTQLNTEPCFAHRCDWRIPNGKELQSIVDYESVNPAVDTAFNANCQANCTVDGANNTTECSCTQSDDYWSGTTYAGNSIFAWGVPFGFGFVFFVAKTDGLYVRAVRCGLLPR